MREVLNNTQRKFVAFLLVFFASCVFLYLERIDQATWFEVTRWNGGFLATATTLEKFAPAIMGKFTPQKKATT